MNFARSSGTVLHVTSLPGRFGIGDVGPQAHAWVDWLAGTGSHIWQILPLVPPGFASSPYASPSAFAGNPLLISPELLVADGLADQAWLEDAPAFPNERVDYPAVAAWKWQLIERTHRRFAAGADPALAASAAAFRADTDWLENYALFAAIQEAHDGAPWWQWPRPLRDHEPAAVAVARSEFADAVERHVFAQWLFFRQWEALHAHCTKQGVFVFGDIPLYVAHDSADVWDNRDLFAIAADGSAEFIAGVPPDMFSDTGQRWGNPQYRWEVHAGDGYRWWLQRLAANFALVDILRIDHFTGFARYWNVPGHIPTAAEGEWRDGPGLGFFQAAERELGRLPIIAEDLGPLGEPVEALRTAAGFPGMKVLQMGFATDSLFLPHNYARDFVAYTGTHDNDTVLGWWEKAEPEERAFALRYMGSDGSDIPADLIRTAWQSVADIAITPMQDFLGLGEEARMNYPGTIEGNWEWRLPPGATSDELAERMRTLNEDFGRHYPPLPS